ncbi:MAG TPA: GAF domain-containing protein [Candidatus Tectomicrobia bacterium]|nr:GAF domain-containing protein [Candidatus Tectomicrobia bacterium]
MTEPRIRGRGAKILHVEDNRENRLLVRAILEAEGHTVIDAEDGLSGIEAALREEPALILLDVNLPGIDGYEVVSVLKGFPALASTPVIAVTAYAMEGDRQRTLVAGCDGYIAKPIDVDRFPRQVEEFLRGKREAVEARDEGVYLRELNQRLVYRLVNQVEDLKRLNEHVERRAMQLADLHRAMQDLTSEVGVRPMLDALLPALAKALGTLALAVDVPEAGVRVEVVTGEAGDRPRRVLAGTAAAAEDWAELTWTLPLTVRGRTLGTMSARHFLPPGAKHDEEQLLNIVANQVAIAVENARLYDGVLRRAAEQQSLVEAGHLLASSLRLADVLHRFAELVRARLGLDVARIWLAEEPGVYRLQAQAGVAGSPADRVRRLEHGEGLIGWIMARLTPLVIADLPVDARVKEREWVTSEALASVVGVPLLLDDHPVGVLLGFSRARREFGPEEVALVQALATSAAVAIRNARLHEETQRRLRHTEVLVGVSQAIGSTLDLGEVLRRATREMVLAFGADFGAAWLRVDGTERYVPLVGYRIPKDLLAKAAEMRVEATDPFFQNAPRTGRAICIEGDSDPRFDTPLGRLIGYRAILVQPVVWKEEVVAGFTILWTREAHRFSTDEMRLAEGIALQCALAIENSRLFEGVKAQMVELKRTQAQLVQSTKLAAIGELAANIAHEINNPLTTVLGFASFIAERLPADDPTREELSLIQEEARRARDIVRDLLQFSRQRDFMPEPADLNAVLEQVMGMLRRQGALSGVQVEEVYGEDLPTVEVDVSRMKQVFLNILNNALYAMRDGGSLTVRTRAEGGTVRVAFSDTGPGIAPEHIGRIFDPFFTTKPEVSGTGLGLSVSLGIVQSHGGSIDVATELGKGTTFTVVLPARPA